VPVLYGSVIFVVSPVGEPLSFMKAIPGFHPCFHLWDHAEHVQNAPRIFSQQPMKIKS